ncbi:hypothetical protein ACTNDY_00440 [Tissierellaceae bacterium HCP3S3_D8]
MTLTIKEAFESMVKYLEMYYERTDSEDIGSLLGDMILLEDGITSDPAVWNDWITCIKIIKQQ